MTNYPPAGGASEGERLLVLISYGLFLIAPTSGGVTALIGVVIAHIRLAYALGTVQESHYRNQIRVFWTQLLLVVLLAAAISFGFGFSLLSLFWPFSPGWPAAMVGVGWVFVLPMAGFAFLILILWYYWRMLRGFVRALDDQPY